MTNTRPQFLDVGDASNKRRIAYILQPPLKAPSTDDALGLIWLLGLKSDMMSTKATALSKWAPRNGYTLTRFDYSAHGSSDGDFSTATITDWLEETRAVFKKLTSGPQILVGSSTGGHIALLLLRELIRSDPAAAARIKGLVLIAPAWDLTEELMWNVFSEDIQREIMETGAYDLPSSYGEPYRITRRFIEDGRDHLFARKPFDPGRGVIALQGQLDTSVPPGHTRDLMKFLQGGWGELIEVADGDHSLSRPQDIELLFEAIEKVADVGQRGGNAAV